MVYSRENSMRIDVLDVTVFGTISLDSCIAVVEMTKLDQNACDKTAFPFKEHLTTFPFYLSVCTYSISIADFAMSATV